MQQEEIDEVISCYDFEKRIIKNPQACILEYYASWCPPCKDLENQKKQILPATTKRKGNWSWFRIDVDEDEKFTEAQNLAGIPTVILYNNGQEVQRFVGLDLLEFQSMLDQLNQMINQQIDNPTNKYQYYQNQNQNQYNNNQQGYNPDQQQQQQQYFNNNQQNYDDSQNYQNNNQYQNQNQTQNVYYNEQNNYHNFQQQQQQGQQQLQNQMIQDEDIFIQTQDTQHQQNQEQGQDYDEDFFA